MSSKRFAETPQINGIEFEWLDDQKLIRVVFKTVHRDLFYELEEYFSALIEEWPSGQPFLILVDFSEEKFSPHIKNIATIIARKLKEKGISGKRAAILPQGFLAGLVKNFMTRLQRENTDLQNRFFDNTEDALAWLRET